MVKAGYVEWDSKKLKLTINDKGVPQGGIISPLLSNLVLHELDMYVEELIQEEVKNNQGVKPTLKNPEYNKITAQIAKAKKEEGLDEKQKKRKVKGLVARRLRVKSTLPNPEYIIMEYVRYADDWIMGI
jgi:retron-type reverse transcriptase